jgi:hypothetical protein
MSSASNIIPIAQSRPTSAGSSATSTSTTCVARPEWALLRSKPFSPIWPCAALWIDQQQEVDLATHGPRQSVMTWATVAATGWTYRRRTLLLPRQRIWKKAPKAQERTTAPSGQTPFVASDMKEPGQEPRLFFDSADCYASNRAYSSSITLSSSFLKSGAGSRSACPGGSSLFAQVPTAPL